MKGDVMDEKTKFVKVVWPIIIICLTFWLFCLATNHVRVWSNDFHVTIDRNMVKLTDLGFNRSGEEIIFANGYFYFRNQQHTYEVLSKTGKYYNVISSFFSGTGSLDTSSVNFFTTSPHGGGGGGAEIAFDSYGNIVIDAGENIIQSDVIAVGNAITIHLRILELRAAIRNYLVFFAIAIALGYSLYLRPSLVWSFSHKFFNKEPDNKKVNRRKVELIGMLLIFLSTLSIFLLLM
jgi:hypothetical protein